MGERYSRVPRPSDTHYSALEWAWQTRSTACGR